MRQGIFGKAYAGYGYDADTETEAKNKYMVGGNVNFFQRLQPSVADRSF